MLSSTCGDSFTYRIDGPKASYLGQGDLSQGFTEMGITAIVIGGPDSDNPLHCAYNITVFPTDILEEKYLTNEPLVFTIFILATFIFTTMVFVAYDCLVQRRHSVVNKTAVESSTIVSSLFPRNVRDRMVTYTKEADKTVENSGAEAYLSTAQEKTNDAPIADL